MIDFVVVIKHQKIFSLTAVFPDNSMGRVSIAHFRSAAFHVVTIAPVKEQNFILAYTAYPRIEDKTIGQFEVNSLASAGLLVGRLRSGSQDSFRRGDSE